MNPRHALLVVTSLLCAHSAAGLITPIVSGLNVYLPIIGAASTAGLGTVLAALGALKLGAVAVLLATSQQQVADEVEAGGYSAPAVEEVDTYGAPAAEVVDSYGAPAHYRYAGIDMSNYKASDEKSIEKDFTTIQHAFCHCHQSNWPSSVSSESIKQKLKDGCQRRLETNDKINLITLPMLKPPPHSLILTPHTQSPPPCQPCLV